MSNFGPRLMQVLESNELIGNGVEGDPYRRVKYYWTLEGEFLAAATDLYGPPVKPTVQATKGESDGS